MKYNFDEVVDRRNTGSMKWNVNEDVLPMWVADMDFKTAPEITTALEKRVKHGVFGYAEVMDDWYEAYISWWKNRYKFSIEKEWLMFCTGVVPAISSIVRKLTTPNENVVIQTPVYNIFFNSIINNGCRVLTSPLSYNDGIYNMDFQDLEEKLKNPQTTLMIICNPHNPVGKIWNRDELAKVGELCNRYGVTVISDEIHCDITEPGTSYIPFASVSEECKNCSITCVAPTKSFNIAGLQTAAIFVPNERLRYKVWRGINTDEVAEPNVFAAVAPVAAYNYGADWLEELRQYVFDNRTYANEFIKNNIPMIRVIEAKATYLMWLDISGCGCDSEEVAKALVEKAGLYLCEGIEYGDEGRYFLRLNLACSRATLNEGLKRLKLGMEKIR